MQSRPRLTTARDFLSWLAAQGIEAETKFHRPHHTVEDAQADRAQLGWTGGFCKNLFLKDKKGQFWLIVTLEERTIRLNTLSKPLGSARLSFANPDLLGDILGVRPGSVTPFALVNDRAQRVRLVLDAPMMAHDQLHYHPLENTATTAISRANLLAFLALTGHEPLVLDLVEATPGTAPAGDDTSFASAEKGR
ncbi:MAG: prolyl-tRNA synthetase associated domain-containing protein [Rhizobiales bacterium]|nr:prolyl-tRNA synthetase associated domain-containing protein [Hyphomicrobiales bacterium]